METVLTSMVKRVDNALYDSIRLVVEGKFKSGKKTFLKLEILKMILFLGK